MAKVVFEDVLRARERIAPFMHKTPMMTCSAIDEMVGKKVYFKCENFQKTGSFKVRGALNAIILLKEKHPDCPGVVTHSSGNHGQAVAYAARTAGLSCSVVVPNDTPMVKRQAIEGYGATLVLCAPSPTARVEACQAIVESEGKVYISSYDNTDVIAGQGTIAAEMLDEVPDLDAVLATICGGGMTSGSSITLKSVRPQAKLFIVEPKGKELEPCLRSGKRLWPNPPQFVDTIAEGCRLQQVGQVAFPILCENAEKDVFTVNNEEIIEAMKIIFTRMKLVIETSASGGLAAVMSERFKQIPNIKKVGIILCGGNTDIDTLPWMKK